MHSSSTNKLTLIAMYMIRNTRNIDRLLSVTSIYDIKVLFNDILFVKKRSKPSEAFKKGFKHVSLESIYWWVCDQRGYCNIKYAVR